MKVEGTPVQINHSESPDGKTGFIAHIPNGSRHVAGEGATEIQAVALLAKALDDCLARMDSCEVDPSEDGEG